MTADPSHGVARVWAGRRIEAEIPPMYALLRRRARRAFRANASNTIRRMMMSAAHPKSGSHPEIPPKSRRNPHEFERWNRADRCNCARCPLKWACQPARLHIVTNQAAILRARRKRVVWADDERVIQSRHRWQLEGARGTAKTRHVLRAIRSRLETMKIQALLTALALAMTLKTWAAGVTPFFVSILASRPARAKPTV